MGLSKLECGDCDRFSVAAIRGRCAHCPARCLQVSAPAIADLCRWQKQWHSSSSSSSSNSEFAVCNKWYSSFNSRVLCSWLCSLLLSECLGSRRYGRGNTAAAAAGAATQSLPHVTSWRKHSVQGRCVHCPARCLQVSTPAIADLCGWQKQWHRSSSSSSSDSEFAECDNYQ